MESLRVSDMCVLYKLELIDDWLWSNWSKSLKNKVSSLEDVINQYQANQFGFVVSGVFTIVVWFFLRSDKADVSGWVILAMLIVCLVFTAKSLIQSYRLLSQFARDVRNLRRTLDLPFKMKGPLEEGYLQSLAILKEEKRAVLTVLDQRERPSVNETRNAYERAHLVFLRFLLVEDNWAVAFNSANRRVDEDKEAAREWALS